MNSQRLIIHGERIETGTWLPVIDPSNGEEFARVPLGNERTIEAAIVSSRTAFETVRRTPSHVRSKQLAAIAHGIESRKAEFVDTIVREAGKPIVYAEAEVARAVMTFTMAAEEARRQHGEVLDMDAFPSGEGHLGLTRRFPIGVIAGITPFNFPLNLVAHKVAPALATGNTIIVKPAPRCPLTALLLGEVIMEAGVPAGQVNVITCANEQVMRLVADERIAMLSFTGSPAVGWPLKAQAGKKKVVLELGGNAAVIVQSDADLAAAIPMIATGGFAYAGQTCISVQRIFVQDSIYDDFRDQFADYVKEKIRMGDPRDRSTVVGPMISPDAAARTRGHLASALAAGGRFVVNSGGEGATLGAIIMEDVPLTDGACKTELFAPVVTLHRYGEFNDALAMVNDSDFGLQAGIFTRDLGLAMQAHDRLDVGAVLINQIPMFRVENMPYGGIKDSGFGREGVRYAMEEMTEIKALIIRR
jgi:acyl-CoA reductase-like NAD-dependent aldehyde dehydrogenase